ncbi:hemolysin family protein [Gordonia sp. w5E2]|uniref:hemolysin family protein n=1 Tax=Gordonia TaxID=2053 RepID=UPI0022E8BAD8|nr:MULTISPECIES: hemolysin family protein [Gordonia]
MMVLLGIVIGILVVFAITALTGYFVAQEFAYMAVDRSRLKARAADGDAAAARALSVTRRTSFMLSGAQLGITVTGLLVGYVAEPLIGSGVGELLGDVGIPVAVGVAIGTVLAVLFSTVVQMVFGELFPKNLSIARPEPVARRLALSTSIYLKVFGPVISLFDAASNLLLKALRIEPVHDVEHSASPRDLEHIVAESREVGELPAELSTLLDRVLDFPTRTAEHAMVPRPLVDFVAADTSLSEVRDLMAVGHTRYPVVGTNPDDVVGIVHLHDLLERLDETSLTAADLARPAAIVPTTLPLPAVLERLDTTSDDEMAVVIDEYGGIAGIITVEDIAEEITGEIDDEHDTTSSEPIELTDAGWLARGDTHLDEVSRVIGHEVAEGDYETLSGLVISTSGGLPQVGDSVELPLADATFGVAAPTVTATVTQVRRRVPATVHLVITESGDADE